MSEFVFVANVSDLPDPGKMLVEVEDRLVVLFRCGEKFSALDDVCTHDGGPLSNGIMDCKAGTIACPRHGAQFDIYSGAAVTMPATQATEAHEVKVDGGKVFVKLRGE
jgi:3-phenylpropionate/trans-cinnamate dioxygenase ferredoxin component